MGYGNDLRQTGPDRLITLQMSVFSLIIAIPEKHALETHKLGAVNRILRLASQFRSGTSQRGKNDGQRNLGKELLPDLGCSLLRIFLREVGNEHSYRDRFILEQRRALHRAMPRFHLYLSPIGFCNSNRWDYDLRAHPCANVRLRNRA
jgi:hypothetical protein